MLNVNGHEDVLMVQPVGAPLAAELTQLIVPGLAQLAVSVTEPPAVIDVVFAEREQVGTGAPTTYAAMLPFEVALTASPLYVAKMA